MTDMTATTVASNNIDDRGANALVRWRYRYIPDHLFGEILSKKWIDNVAPLHLPDPDGRPFRQPDPRLLRCRSVANSTRTRRIRLRRSGHDDRHGGGRIDLSVGSNFALGNFVALAVMNVLGWPVWAALPLTVLACAGVGLVNGILVGLLRLRAFLTTLVTLIIVRAVVDMLLLKYAVTISGGFVDDPVWDFSASDRVRHSLQLHPADDRGRHRPCHPVADAARCA